MYPLNSAQLTLHEQALQLSRQHRTLEAELISLLMQIDKTKLYKKLGCPSLFIYAVKELKFSESIAYAFINVARKASQVAPLKEAIARRELSVAKANRIVSALSQQNAAQLVEFAKTHSTRATEMAVAEISPRTRGPERVKPIAKDLLRLEMAVSAQIYEKLKRAQSVVAQKANQSPTLEQTLDAALEAYLDHHDPLRKAERAKRRVELCARKVTSRQRTPVPSGIKHQVYSRDKGRCTHVNDQGERCGSDRWVDIHHIREVSRGGTHELQNLTILCAFHHDLVHQLSLPVDGAVNWLRSPSVLYSA